LSAQGSANEAEPCATNLTMISTEPSSYISGLFVSLPEAKDRAYLTALIKAIRSELQVNALRVPFADQACLDQINSLPEEVLAQIECLELPNCYAFRDMSALVRLSNLKILVMSDHPLKANLDFRWFPKLEQFIGDFTDPRLHNMHTSSVTEIRAMGTKGSKIKDFTHIGLPSGLKKLMISHYNVSGFNGLSALKQLNHLTCIYISGKRDFTDIVHCMHLEELVFMQMGKMTSIQMPTPPRLKYLNTYGTQLDALDFVQKMPHLVKLAAPKVQPTADVTHVRSRKWEFLSLPKKMMK
jgi:hypothetical protein